MDTPGLFRFVEIIQLITRAKKIVYMRICMLLRVCTRSKGDVTRIPALHGNGQLSLRKMGASEHRLSHGYSASLAVRRVSRVC